MPGLFRPIQNYLIHESVHIPRFIQSAVLVPRTSPKYPNHSSPYDSQNTLCKAGASQLLLVLLILHLSKCLVKSVSSVSILFLSSNYHPCEDTMCFTCFKLPHRNDSWRHFYIDLNAREERTWYNSWDGWQFFYYSGRK